MTVYVVSAGYDYEGAGVVGVFDDYEVAYEFASHVNTVFGRSFDYSSVERWEMGVRSENADNVTHIEQPK